MKHLAFISIALLSAALSSKAATLAGSISGSNFDTPEGGSVDQSFGLIASTQELKLFGELGIFTAENIGGQSVGNQIDLSGSFSLEEGEAFSLAYEFETDLQGGGDVSITIAAVATVGNESVTLNRTETFSGDSLREFTFAAPGPVAPAAVTGNWTGTVTIDWTNAPADSALFVTIPQNSVDFIAGAPVPEPSSALLVSLGAIALLKRRRA